MSGFQDLVEVEEAEILDHTEEPDLSLLRKEQLTQLVVQAFLRGQPIEGPDGIAERFGISLGRANSIISTYRTEVRTERARSLRALTRAQEESLLDARKALVEEAQASVETLVRLRDSGPAKIAKEAAIALLDRAGLTPRAGETVVNPSLESPSPDAAGPITAAVVQDIRRMVEALAQPHESPQIPPIPQRKALVEQITEESEVEDDTER